MMDDPSKKGIATLIKEWLSVLLLLIKMWDKFRG
jgi:hypothetical protein